MLWSHRLSLISVLTGRIIATLVVCDLWTLIRSPDPGELGDRRRITRANPG
jgi:hypothetical protein